VDSRQGEAAQFVQVIVPGVFAVLRKTKPFTAILEKSGLARNEKLIATWRWDRVQCRRVTASVKVRT
jgi:hypothetical protein